MSSEIVVGPADGVLEAKMQLELPGGPRIIKCFAGCSLPDIHNALVAIGVMTAGQQLAKGGGPVSPIPSDTPVASLNRCKLQIVGNSTGGVAATASGSAVAMTVGAATPSSPASALSQTVGIAGCSEMKDFRMRIRKIDNQNVVVSGKLPADGTLQSLADEIVKLGHSSAEPFSLLLPPFAGRPPTVYEPKDFTMSLESCGIFASSMSVSIQKFGKAEPVSQVQGRKLGNNPPLPHKVPVPPEFVRHIESSAIRRAAELALPNCQEHWGQRRFGKGTLDEEKKRCIEYFESEEREMTQLLQNIWKGDTWPDSSEIHRPLFVCTFC